MRQQVDLGREHQGRGRNHVGILQRLVLALGDGGDDHLVRLAEIEARGTYQVADVLDKEHAVFEGKVVEGAMHHVGIQVTAAAGVDRLPCAVIEGDQETSADADRIRATGAPALQVNTGRGCHLDADMVHRAFHHLPLEDGVLFIENVGNLVCPAGFDLGEAHKVVIASVTEGEDKPLKYPNMFAAASLMLVSKVDLLPHLDFDVDALIANARRVNPGIAVIKVSATTDEGLDRWMQWIDAARAMAVAAR